MELPGSRVCVCSTSVDTPRTFPKCPLSLPAPSSVGCPSCSAASPALGIFHHFHFRHSSECAPVPHSHLPNDQQSWTVLSVYETHERGYSIHSFVTCLLKSLSMFVTFSFSCWCAGVLCTCASPLTTCMLPITISDMEHHVMTFEEFFFPFFFSFMAMLWGLQDLSSPARDWTQAPAMGVPSPKHWKDQPGNSRNFSEGATSGGCQTRGLVTIESHSRSRDRGSRAPTVFPEPREGWCWEVGWASFYPPVSCWCLHGLNHRWVSEEAQRLRVQALRAQRKRRVVCIKGRWGAEEMNLLKWVTRDYLKMASPRLRNCSLHGPRGLQGNHRTWP